MQRFAPQVIENQLTRGINGAVGPATAVFDSTLGKASVRVTVDNVSSSVIEPVPKKFIKKVELTFHKPHPYDPSVPPAVMKLTADCLRGTAIPDKDEPPVWNITMEVNGRRVMGKRKYLSDFKMENEGPLQLVNDRILYMQIHSDISDAKRNPLFGLSRLGFGGRGA